MAPPLQYRNICFRMNVKNVRSATWQDDKSICPAILGGFMRYLFAFLFSCTLFCASAFPQDTGVIQCDPGSTGPVPAWVSPGKPHVLEHLNCGQMVSVIGVGSYSTVSQYSSRPMEYVKIQIGDKEAYVDARNVRLLGSQERSKVNKTQIAVPDKRSTREEEERKKWTLISKDNVKLRDEALLAPIYTNGPRTFTATLSNSSAFAVSHLHLLVRIYDCSGKPKSDYSNCEIIGEVKPVISASIPAGQTRLVRGSTAFEATPRVRGTFAWGYQILGIRAE